MVTVSQAMRAGVKFPCQSEQFSTSHAMTGIVGCAQQKAAPARERLDKTVASSAVAAAHR
jgi:hypothetical protein